MDPWRLLYRRKVCRDGGDSIDPPVKLYEHIENYKTPTRSRINDFTPKSRTFSALAQDG